MTLARVLPFAALMAAMACFQLGAALAKALFPAVGPEGTAALRLLLAAAMMLAVIRPWRRLGRKAPWLPIAGLGVAMGGVVLLFYMAIQRVPLGVAVALQFLGPLSIALLGAKRPLDLAWAVLAGAGVLGLVGRLPGNAAIDPIGIGLALGAAGCWAAYILCGRAASATSGIAAGAFAMAIAAAVVLPVGVLHAGAALLSPALLPIALLVALVSTAIPFSLEFYALPRIPARVFAVFSSLEPAFGALSGLVLLHERLGVAQWAGLAAVVIAAGGAAWSIGADAKVAPT